MQIFDLIFDRTAGDVSRGTEKGFYRHRDLNRVRAAVLDLRERLSAAGYLLPPVSPLTEWHENDVPRRSGIEELLRAVRLFDGIFAGVRPSSGFPASADSLDWRGANAVEEFLFRLGRTEEAVEDGWAYCGEVNAGEVY